MGKRHRGTDRQRRARDRHRRQAFADLDVLELTKTPAFRGLLEHLVPEVIPDADLLLVFVITGLDAELQPEAIAHVRGCARCAELGAAEAFQIGP